MDNVEILKNIIIPIVSAIIGGLCTFLGVLITILHEKKKEKEERKKTKEKKGDTYIKEKDGFPYDEIIEYLNNKVGSNYKTDSKEIIKLINQRLEEGFTKEDFFIVIDKKHKEWDGTEYSKYLRPKTLFGDKFESYVNQPEPIKSKYDGFNWNSLIANLDDMEF